LTIGKIEKKSDPSTQLSDTSPRVGLLFDCCIARHLAAGARAAGDTRALAGLLPTRDLVARPLPVGASTRGTENVGVGARAGNTNSVVGHGETSDWDTVSGLASGRTVLVVLLDDNTVLGNTRENVARVGNTRNLASSAVDCLDTKTILRVGHLVVQELNARDGVVITTTNGADGETVAPSAGRARNSDVGSRVDGDTVILESMLALKCHRDRATKMIYLVVDVGTIDGDTGGRTNVESIGVVALVIAVTRRVIDGNASESQLFGVVDGEDLDRRILDLDVLDLGVGHAVGVEELRLGLAAVSTLAVPPSAAITIDDRSRGTDDGDVVTRNGDERTLPLLVAESGSALEGNSGARSQVGQVKGGTSGNDSILDDDARARLLLLESVGSGRGAREGTAAPLLESRSRDGCTTEKSCDSKARELNHDCFSKKKVLRK
jgi:hypothetical protein